MHIFIPPDAPDDEVAGVFIAVEILGDWEAGLPGTTLPLIANLVANAFENLWQKRAK